MNWFKKTTLVVALGAGFAFGCSDDDVVNTVDGGGGTTGTGGVDAAAGTGGTTVVLPDAAITEVGSAVEVGTSPDAAPSVCTTEACHLAIINADPVTGVTAQVVAGSTPAVYPACAQ